MCFVDVAVAVHSTVTVVVAADVAVVVVIAAAAGILAVHVTQRKC